MANGIAHERFINKQLLTTIALVLSILYIVVDKAFLQVGSVSARIERRVEQNTAVLNADNERLARLEECVQSLRAVPAQVAAQTEAIASLVKSVDKLEAKVDAHMRADK